MQIVPEAQSVPAEQSPPRATVGDAARQVPAQHWYCAQVPCSCAHVPPPAHSAKEKQAPPAATVPVKMALHAGSGAMLATSLRLHEPTALYVLRQLCALAPS